MTPSIAEPPTHGTAPAVPALRVEPFLDPAKSLTCIHCGLCLGSCPTYLETGDENDSPRGRIHLMRALQEGRLPLAAEPVRHLDLCLGCRACESACPSGVPYGELIEATRDHIERRYRRPLWAKALRRVAIEKIFPYPWRLKLALLPARLVKRLGVERVLPKFLREALALVPDTMADFPLPECSPADPAVPKRGRVGFLSGCVMSVMFAPTNAATVRLLNRAGYDVITPRGQGCCGALDAHSGRLARARDKARRNLVAFEGLNLDAIIINAAGCGSTLKEYGHLLHADSAWAERAQRFSGKVKDFTEWLARAECGMRNAECGMKPGASPVTYHDACHLAHPQRVTRPPRDLVRAVARDKYVELPEADVCCGSAGSYNLTEPAMAQRLQQRKVQHILATGARVVITTNPGCLLQIRAGLRAAGADHVQALHLADYLDAATSTASETTPTA